MLALPVGAIYNPTNLTVQWTPAEGLGGRVETLRLRVWDDAACNALSVTQEVAIVVFDPAQGGVLPLGHTTSAGATSR